MPGLSFLSKKKWHTGTYANQEAVWLVMLLFKKLYLLNYQLIKFNLSQAEQRTKERIIDERAAIEEIQLKLAQPSVPSDDHGKSEVRFLYEHPNEKINQIEAMNKKTQENGITIEDPLVVEFRNKLENVNSQKEVKNDESIEQIEVTEVKKPNKTKRRRNNTVDPLEYINEMFYSIDSDNFDDLDVNLIATLQKKKQKKLLKRILEIEKGNSK